MKKILSLLILSALMLILATSCKKKTGDAPELPPAESMAIDFSNFVSAAKSADFMSVPKGVENSNWEFAALVAGTWNTIITTTLIVPVSAFKVALDQTPTYLEGKKWQWSYTATVASTAYTVKLTGEIRTSDVKWEMYVSKTGGTNTYTDFLWVEGTSNIDGTGGQWIMNYSNTYKEPVIQIDWTKTGTEMGTVKYTYVRTLNDNRATDPYKTSYIEYGKTSSTTYNAYYTIYIYSSILQKFITVNIEWNTTNHNGRIKCNEYYGNTNWNCWDANKINIVCPS